MTVITPGGRVPETVSERLFDKYLDSHGYEGWLFEPTINDQPKHPDVLLPCEGSHFLFEVKERLRKPSEPGFQWIDPMKGIREEIGEAQRKFKAFKDFPCSLVIYNAGDIDTLLEPMWIFGAMLGDPGFTLAYDDAKGALRPKTARNILMSQRGKMVRYKTGEPQNRTINAIIILEDCMLPDREFERARDVAIAAAEKKSGGRLTEVDRCGIAGKLYLEHPSRNRAVVRVLVCENPRARIPLPQTMFRGEYDERWRLIKGEETKVWSGDKVLDLEPGYFGRGDDERPNLAGARRLDGTTYNKNSDCDGVHF